MSGRGIVVEGFAGCEASGRRLSGADCSFAVELAKSECLPVAVSEPDDSIASTAALSAGIGMLFSLA